MTQSPGAGEGERGAGSVTDLVGDVRKRGHSRQAVKVAVGSAHLSASLAVRGPDQPIPE